MDDCNNHNIVGPSDHYGTVHQFGPSLSNHHHYMTSSTNHNNNSNNNDNVRSNGISNYASEPSTTSKPPPLINNSYQPSMSHEETKVCVIIDSRTPVIIKIPVPQSQITLGDLKAALPAIDQPNYKYFFKSNDSEFGLVKEEIQYDDSKLPTYRDRVVAWIVTPAKMNDDRPPKSETDTCNMTYTNTSYDDCSSSLLTTDIESTSYLTETDDDSLSFSNYSRTTCDTFVSQRRNRLYDRADGPSHHEHHHHHSSRRSNDSPYRHQARGRNISNPSPPTSSSSSSSASRSDATAVQCLTVHLVLTNENFLGLHIYANSVDGLDEGIYVDGVTENSAVAQDGRIEPGDKLIQVNETNLEELSNEQAVKVLKDAVIKRGPIKLVVAKFIETNKNGPLDSILGRGEAVHPIDTAAWVAHAQAITMPNCPDQANSTTSSPSFGSNAQDTDCIRPASVGMLRLATGLGLNRATSDIKEIIHHMTMPEIGLDIRDRDWLKIKIPRAFLGTDLINWLERNVYGFTNTRDAKKYASRMLKEGYIKDPISKNSFSSKSYYTFVT